MNISHRLPSTPLIAAALGLGLAVSACAPAESEYVGEDRSGLTEEVDARSPVVPGPEAVSYTHLTLPTNTVTCRCRWSPDH